VAGGVDLDALARKVVLLLLLGLLFFLAVYHLDEYPPVSFDEGIHLQVPKNLVLYGEYAVRENGVLRRFDSSVSTGPPLLVPIALAFRLSGIDLWNARFVTVMYLMLTAAVFYRLAERLYGPDVGLLALGLAVASPGLGLLPLGRQVMGEVPALFFFLLGTLIWSRAVESRRPLSLVLAGVAMGMAMITKTIYALVLPVPWLLVWLADRWRYRRLSLACFLFPLAAGLASLGVWYVYGLVNLGLSIAEQRTLELATSAGRSIFVFELKRALVSLKFLLGPNFYLALGIPGLAHSLYQRVKGGRSLLELQRLLPLVTAVVWLAWYVFGSVGWERYAFPALIVTALFVARLCLDLASRLVRFLQSRMGKRRKAAIPTVYGLGSVAVMALFCFFPFYRTSLYEEVTALVDADDDGLRGFAAYLTAHVPSDALIESWEWPVDFFTERTYRHPPLSTLDLMVRHVFLGKPYSPDVYDFEQHPPDYLIDGPFSKWTGFYPRDYLDRECTLSTSVGEYDLYRVKAGQEWGPDGEHGVDHP